MASAPTRDRYTIRKQSSGRTFSETFYVYDRQRKGRVSVGPLSREQAAASAGDLNAVIGWDR
jgi:hypothetical protein